MAATAAGSASAWSPFGHRAFAVLWTATVVSNIGTWVYAAAAGWQMTLLAPSPQMVSLVQAVTTLPVFLFALPAGALADIVDRRKLLIATQSALMAVVLLLAVLTLFDRVTPGILLVFTFLTGVGAALVAPAWQAVVPELVPHADLQPAVALNSVGINISRAVGPALAGALIAILGIASPYFVDAASFIGVIAALLWWHRQATTTALPAERFVGAIRVGLRYARRSPPLQATLVRALAFFLFASAYWALLPLIAKELLNGGPTLFGTLLACIGAGAVAGALILPQIRNAVGPDRLVTGGTLATAATMLALALARNTTIVALSCLIAGVAWIAVLSSLNVAAQIALPDWVKARGLSVYLVVFFGGMTGGSVVWGQVADALDIPTSLIIAACGAVVALIVAWRWKLSGGEVLDLAPSMHWPAPIVAGEVEPDRGPVMAVVEYLIDPEEADGFIAAMEAQARERRRDGAYAWGLFEDTGQPGRYIEYFLEGSWLEHLRHHERVTQADWVLQEQVRAYHRGEAPPRVQHFLAAAPRPTGRSS